MKYNLKTCTVSAVGLIFLFSLLSYIMAPSADKFDWNSINPIGFIEGFVFALGFGLGFPVWLSVIILGGLSFLFFMLFLWIASKLLR